MPPLPPAEGRWHTRALDVENQIPFRSIHIISSRFTHFIDTTFVLGSFAGAAPRDQGLPGTGVVALKLRWGRLLPPEISELENQIPVHFSHLTD